MRAALHCLVDRAGGVGGHSRADGAVDVGDDHLAARAVLSLGEDGGAWGGGEQQGERRADAQGAYPAPHRGTSAAAFTLSLEHLFEEDGADDEVGRVDDLADLQVYGNAAYDVGLVAGEAALAEEVDHLQEGVLHAQLRSSPALEPSGRMGMPIVAMKRWGMP